ncbi:MAG: hypothetical protein AAF573_07660 [Bacteroidota bacterium]
MKLAKHVLVVGITFFLFTCAMPLSAQSSYLTKPIPPENFNQEEVEKIKTLIERHFQSKISQAEFSMYGKPNERNLALFKKIDERMKDDPFFSQEHVTYVIESMEYRMGKRKPKKSEN